MLYGFGQSDNGIIQTAYTVPDLKAAIDTWVTELKVGPWFVIDRFVGDEAQYRGGQSTAAVTIAMSFAGHMNIELIQPLDDEPSVYREAIQARGHGFHHFGLSTMDFDRDVAAYKAKGYDLAFLARVPTGGRVGYMDGNDALPGMLEFIEGSAEMDKAFTRFYTASIDWDGKDPVRPFV